MSIQVINITSRKEWLELRKNDVTASDIAALFGVSPYKSAYELFVEKQTGEDFIEDNSALKRGRWLEPSFVVAAGEECGMVIDKCNQYFRSEECRIGATPDFITGGCQYRFPVEAKVVNKDVFKKDWDCGVPLHIMIQAIVQAMLMRSSRTTVLAMVVDSWGAELKDFEVPRHPEFEAVIYEKVKEFWQRIENNLPYDPDFGKDGDVIRHVYKNGDGEPIDLSTHNRIGELCEQYLSALESEKEAKANKTAAQNEILHIIGDAREAIHPIYRIKAPVVHKVAYTVKASSSRRLNVGLNT